MVDVGPPRSRRLDILAAAEREFAAAGLAGARIERIAERAGVNKQLLFHYFQSKTGLFTAVLHAVLARHEPAETGSDDPASALRRYLGALELLARSTPGLVAVLTADREAIPPEVALVAQEWMTRTRSRIAVALEDGQRRGYYRDDIDPEHVARLGVAAALGVGAFADPSAGTASMINVLQDYCAWR